MVRTIGRRFLWLYALLVLITAVAYARFDLYAMDGDGTAFMDIVQDLRSGHAALAINGYWNPGYPAVLAAMDSIARPTLWNELATLRYINVGIFLLAMLACLFFTGELARGRDLKGDGEVNAAVPRYALHLLGLALLLFSLGRELPVAAPRSDTLLMMFLLLAAALVLRLLNGAGFWAYPALGLALGCAYLTKSFAFLPSVTLILALGLYALLGKRQNRIRGLGGTALLALVFALTAGPYILAISRQLGHLTTGESARLNYAFFIDNTQRWHEWYHGTLGHAGGTFLHPEAVLAGPPPVFSFAAHPYGTFPLWFDPAWWTLGIKPHVYLRGHGLRALRNTALLARYLLERPEIFVLLAVAVGFGAVWPRLRARRHLQANLWALAPIVWGLLMFAIYFPIDLQARYLTAPFLLFLLPVFALLRVRPQSSEAAAENRFIGTSTTCSALVVLFAGIGLAQAFTFLAERRRQTPPAEQHHPGYDREIFPAAAALDQLGLQPGDKIACMGDRACYTDHYWARLAGTQILAQVETPGEADPQLFWNSIPDKAAITEPLRRMGLRYIVTQFGNSVRKPEGWVQLGHSDFFAYPLQAPVSTSEAAAIASYEPTP